MMNVFPTPARIFDTLGAAVSVEVQNIEDSSLVCVERCGEVILEMTAHSVRQLIQALEATLPDEGEVAAIA